MRPETPGSIAGTGVVSDWKPAGIIKGDLVVLGVDRPDCDWLSARLHIGTLCPITHSWTNNGITNSPNGLAPPKCRPINHYISSDWQYSVTKCRDITGYPSHIFYWLSSLPSFGPSRHSPQSAGVLPLWRSRSGYYVFCHHRHSVHYGQSISDNTCKARPYPGIA